MLLALDTATPSLALSLGSAQLITLIERAHAERLPEALAHLLEEAGQPPITGIVVGTGPGSYTGVRVGASFALGLGRAWGVAVRGVSTLESLIDAQLSGVQAVSLDARKGMLYGAVYQVQAGRVQREVHPPAKYTQEKFAALAAGQLWRRDPVPDPAALARAGHHHGQTHWELLYL